MTEGLTLVAILPNSSYSRGIMWTYLLQGVTLGFAAGAQPGPFQTYLITQSLSNGWRRTLIAALAPLVSDGPVIALVLLVLNQMPIWLQRGISIAGGAFILYLAWNASREWLYFDERPADTSPGGQSLLRAALTNLLSPGPYIFWSLVNGPILLKGWQETPLNGLSFLLGFYGMFVLVNIIIIVLAGLAGQAGDRVRRAMLGIASLALTGFGLFQLWLGILG
ncbi:MAG: LysE family translocator [Chloroflexi bacterium]|nr:LysE family translocator [Chloroflexota bacterium]